MGLVNLMLVIAVAQKRLMIPGSTSNDTQPTGIIVLHGMNSGTDNQKFYHTRLTNEFNTTVLHRNSTACVV